MVFVSRIEDMKLTNLRDFLAVVEQRSLRAAARELGIAQPAITRSIQALERELGVPLFERQTRGVVPTAMGKAFLRRARIVSNELARAREEIEQLRGNMRGHVRVALSMVPHMALLPYALKQFRVRYPEVHLDIIDTLFQPVGSKISNGTFDCYIGPPPENLPGGLTQEILFENTRTIVGRTGHPLGHAKSLRELGNAEWMSTSITASAQEELGPLFLAHRLPPPKIMLQAHAALTIMVSLTNSDLLAMVPVQWTDFPPTRDLLQIIDVVETLPAPPICIIQCAGLPLTPVAEHFCDLIRRAAEHHRTRTAPIPSRSPKPKGDSRKLP